MESDINTDNLLQELGGCGRFQIIMASVAYLPQLSFAFSMLFMSFGAFIPGWRCLDNGTSATNGTDDPTGDYNTELKCRDFMACKTPQFNPEASTIVTEWGLVCDKEWIPYTMMSLQMVGVLVGTLMHGLLGDKFGRKKTLYSFVFMNFFLNCIGIFSASWEGYMVLRILLGVTCGVVGYIPCVFITEFVTPVWRVRISSLPLWSTGAMLFGVVVMVTKDWKQIHLVSAVIPAVCLLGVFWVPESLRWLLVHGKKKEVIKVAKKISFWNRKIVPHENLNKLIAYHTSNNDNTDTDTKTSTVFDLFRSKRIRFTMVFGVLFLSIDLIYYATSFGIASLPGNLYVNFFILFASELPSNLISSTIPNILGRRKVCMIFYALQAVCLFCVVAVDKYTSGHVRLVAILVLVVIARLCLCVDWYVILAYIAEIYPTVIRSTASGYGGLMAALGSIIAPYLIPPEPSERYICYLIMGGFTLFCCVLLPLLPETKDAPLYDTWDRNDDEERRDSLFEEDNEVLRNTRESTDQ